MIYLPFSSTDPYFNLAVEEHLLTKRKGDMAYFLLWQNDRTIVVGAHQNTAEEINAPYVREQGIRVARRLTGGGAVFHDLGNLNYSLIVDRSAAEEHPYRFFVQPLLRALQALGVPAEIGGRNDVLLHGKKICGTAQCIRGESLLHHGCILVDSDLDMVSNALRPPKDKYLSKGIPSVRSRVTTVNGESPAPITTDALRLALLREMESSRDLVTRRLEEEDLSQIETLKKTKYETWDWIYGRSPAYNVRKERRFPFGSVTACLDIRGGTITQAKLYGDFFGNAPLEELEARLCGLSLQDTLPSLLKDWPLESYITGMTAEHLAALLLS